MEIAFNNYQNYTCYDNYFEDDEDDEMDRRAEEERCKDLEHATDETPEVRK